MELYKEILVDLLSKSNVKIELVNVTGDMNEKIEMLSYEMLKKIRDIIREDSDDEDCFMKIEKIVCLFESMEIDCGERHDF